MNGCFVSVRREQGFGSADMNKKTLTILISSILAVLILAGVATWLSFKVFKWNEPKEDSVSSSDTVSAGQDDGETAEDGEAETGGSQTGSGNSQESGQKAGGKGSSGTADNQTDGGSTGTSSKKAASLGKTAITVKSQSAKKGETVKVPVELTDNPGIVAFLLEFTYDANSLEYCGFEKTELYTEYQENAKSGSIKMIIMADQDVAEDGNLVYLKFKVKDGAKGSTDIKVISGDSNICNYAEEVIPCKMVNGTVTVK